MEKGCTVSQNRVRSESLAFGAQGRRTQPAGAPKWILVMSDEEIIRVVVRVMLEKAGHSVYVAENHDEAVACCQEAHNCGYPFDAAILDLNNRAGKAIRETITQLNAITPAIKVIAASGDSQDPLMLDYKRHGFSGAVAKPFSYNELMNVVQASLRR